MILLGKCKDLEFPFGDVQNHKDELVISNNGEFVYTAEYSEKYFRRMGWFRIHYTAAVLPDGIHIWSIK